jgi:hypothetical protein
MLDAAARMARLYHAHHPSTRVTQVALTICYTVIERSGAELTISDMMGLLSDDVLRQYFPEDSFGPLPLDQQVVLTHPAAQAAVVALAAGMGDDTRRRVFPKGLPTCAPVSGSTLVDTLCAPNRGETDGDTVVRGASNTDIPRAVVGKLKLLRKSKHKHLFFSAHERRCFLVDTLRKRLHQLGLCPPLPATAVARRVRTVLRQQCLLFGSDNSLQSSLSPQEYDDLGALAGGGQLPVQDGARGTWLTTQLLALVTALEVDSPTYFERGCASDIAREHQRTVAFREEGDALIRQTLAATIPLISERVLRKRRAKKGRAAGKDSGPSAVVLVARSATQAPPRTFQQRTRLQKARAIVHAYATSTTLRDHVRGNFLAIDAKCEVPEVSDPKGDAIARGLAGAGLALCAPPVLAVSNADKIAASNGCTPEEPPRPTRELPGLEMEKSGLEAMLVTVRGMLRPLVGFGEDAFPAADHVRKGTTTPVLLVAFWLATVCPCTTPFFTSLRHRLNPAWDATTERDGLFLAFPAVYKRVWGLAQVHGMQASHFEAIFGRELTYGPATREALGGVRADKLECAARAHVSPLTVVASVSRLPAVLAIPASEPGTVCSTEFGKPGGVAAPLGSRVERGAGLLTNDQILENARVPSCLRASFPNIGIARHVSNKRALTPRARIWRAQSAARRRASDLTVRAPQVGDGVAVVGNRPIDAVADMRLCSNVRRGVTSASSTFAMDEARGGTLLVPATNTTSHKGTAPHLWDMLSDAARQRLPDICGQVRL